MNKKPIEKPKEVIDESNIDWSTFGDDWAKLYYGVARESKRTIAEVTAPELSDM